MTNTRINHTGHDHPNTSAARTACRKSVLDSMSTMADALDYVAPATESRKPRHLRIGMEINVEGTWVMISNLSFMTSPGSRGVYVITLMNTAQITCEGGRSFDVRG